jgi:hypothetical protein
MICRATEIIQLENNRLAARNGDIAIRSETADAVVGRTSRNGVIDVNKLVVGKIGIEGHTQESTLAAGSSRHRDKRSWQQRSLADNAQGSSLLADKEAAVG